MRRIILIFSFLSLLISCCKDEHQDIYPIVGTWEIVKMDSCLHPGRGSDPFIHLSSLDYDGTLNFNQDFSGEINIDGGRVLVESDSTFIWVYDEINSFIDLCFDSGTTSAIIASHNELSLEIYFRDYNYPSSFIIVPYYYLKLRRLQ